MSLGIDARALVDDKPRYIVPEILKTDLICVCGRLIHIRPPECGST